MSSAVATHAVAGGCRPLRRASTSAVRVPPTSTASRRPRVRHVCGTQPPLPGPEHPEHPERALLRRMARRVCRQRLRANPRTCKVLVMHADTQLPTPAPHLPRKPYSGMSRRRHPPVQCSHGSTVPATLTTHVSLVATHQLPQGSSISHADAAHAGAGWPVAVRASQRQDQEERWSSEPSFPPPRRSSGGGGRAPPPPPPNGGGGPGDNARRLFTPALVAAAFVVPATSRPALPSGSISGS